ncbi:MAG TPA: hypothetical protein VL128_13845 [Candidatus Eisenbacteria bacterium]|nr:hypothetical protein [Candidatus Eisenbacteria bacterium]
MTTENSKSAAKSAPRISLDAWAVFLALAAAALIRFGVIPRVPW